MRRLPGALARLAAVVALVVSGVYVVLYLYRWEWHRALIAGVLFVAAEVAVVGFALLDRMGGERPSAPLPAPTTESHRFPWLDPGGLAVFVPVLLGLGILLTLAASVVERVARWTAPAASTPSVLAGLDRLEHLDPLVAAAPTGATAGQRRGQALLAVAAVAAVSVLAAGGLHWLADVAQSRAEPPDPAAVTMIDLDVSVRGSRWSPAQAGERLAHLCVPDPVFTATVQPGVDGRLQVVVAPAPGRTDLRKLTGCLRDATLDGANAQVVTVATRPAPPPAGP